MYSIPRLDESSHDPVMSARAALARIVRQRPAPLDQIDFDAPCPECGNEASWHEERVETRIRIKITCPCSPEDNVVDSCEPMPWDEGAAATQPIPLLEAPHDMWPHGRSPRRVRRGFS